MMHKLIEGAKKTLRLIVEIRENMNLIINERVNESIIKIGMEHHRGVFYRGFTLLGVFMSKSISLQKHSYIMRLVGLFNSS